MTARYIRTQRDLNEIIVLGKTTEGLHLDFKVADKWPTPKGTPDPVKKEKQRELCRDVAQFANTDGGTLVLGIREELTASNLKVAKRIEAVQHPDRLREWVEEAIKNFCVPSTFTHDVEILSTETGPVLAVLVPPSLNAIYVWDRSAGSIEVVGRTSHGKKYLNPDEMERHLMDGSRAARLAVERAVVAAKNEDVVLVGGVMHYDVGHRRWWPVKAGPIRRGPSDDMSFQLRIPLPGVAGIPLLAVPYGLVREAWVDAAGRLNLLLSMRVIAEAGDLRFSTELGP